MYCVDFAENTLFSSFGVFAHNHSAFTLSYELLMDRMTNGDSDGFFSGRLVCRSSGSS